MIVLLARIFAPMILTLGHSGIVNSSCSNNLFLLVKIFRIVTLTATSIPSAPEKYRMEKLFSAILLNHVMRYITRKLFSDFCISCNFILARMSSVKKIARPENDLNICSCHVMGYMAAKIIWGCFC